jgi:aminoglycoside phosphotransferase family enzyme/predicted kinase
MNERMSTVHSTVEPLPDGMLDELIPPESDGEFVQHIQTHISHVFLTHERVYKIRKAVRFPFLDFSSRDARNRDCLDEVRLNRRLTPDVYLGVSAIKHFSGGWKLGALREDLDEGPGSEEYEHCVVMRRLPQGGDAQSLVENGRLTREHLEGIADRLARFHDANRLEDPGFYSEAEWFERISHPILQTLEMIRAEPDGPEIEQRADALALASRRGLEACAEHIEARHRGGFSVNGHGDLQLGHVWFEGDASAPLIIDCTEFSRNFRTIDPASEVAFLAMDLVYCGHPELAEHFLARYARDTDDFGLYWLVDLYSSYRAAVRAKVGLLASHDDTIEAAQRATWLTSARDHLAVAEGFLAARAGGAVVVTCGVVGSGKSTLANALARELAAVPIASDRIRKRQAGLRDDDHRAACDDPHAGLYDESHTTAVYSGLLERAEAVISSGRCVVLDATFALESQRRSVLSWAAKKGIPAYLIEAYCAPEIALERLRAREREGSDPSDAGPSLYEWSVERFAAPLEWPEKDRARIDTDKPSWRDDLRRIPFVRKLSKSSSP